ncbi:MAG: pyridoxal-phosphate dependent enzyme [SAR324 cluster bacterium]|nr:pyridoxal-phosphate dependent enzyme [SAR324 cluster bacterium]
MTEQPLPTLEGIRRAAHDLALHMAPTPLVHSEILSRALEADVWLKLEVASPIASFKLRGALNTILQAQARDRVTSAVATTTGNHGQGVAYAARMTGLPAHIFLPNPANAVKKAMILAFGGQVHEQGANLDEAREAALGHCAGQGGLYIEDGDSLDMMEGAATMGLEVAEALPDIGTLIVPMGSGNAIGGAAVALKAIQPAARAVAVPAKSAPAMARSFQAGKPVAVPSHTLADGLAVVTPARLALAAMLAFVDDVWMVSDEDMMSAVHTLAECAHVLTEPSGAAALAGAWRHRETLRGQRVVLTLTGANISTEMLSQALRGQPLFTLDQFGGG